MSILLLYSRTDLRCSKPLAYTKTFSMAAAALLSITLVPVLMGIFIRGKIRPEEKNPITRFLIYIYRIYRPAITKVLKYKKTTVVLAVIALALTVIPL